MPAPGKLDIDDRVCEHLRTLILYARGQCDFYGNKGEHDKARIYCEMYDNAHQWLEALDPN